MTRSTIATAVLLALAGSAAAQSTDAPPTRPGNFRATLYDNAGGELFWERSTDDRGAVRGYEITRNGQNLGIRDALSLYDRSLEPGVAYTFTVAAVDGAGQRSAVATTTLGGGTAPPPSGDGPAAPSELRAAVYSKRSAEIFWQREPAALALRYEILRDGRVIGTTDGVSFYFRGLTAATDYGFEVVAIDRRGRRSSPSSIGFRTDGSAPPDAGGPPAPAELRAEVYSKRSLELFWRRESASLALRYEILRDGEVVATTNGVSYYARSLTAGTEYAFEVVAIGRDGRRSASARIAVRTDGGARPGPGTPALAAPAGLRADVYSATAAELFWDRAATPGLRYEIRRDGTLVGTTDGTSFYDDTLSDGASVRYEVVALGGGGRSEASTVDVTAGGSRGDGTTLPVRDDFGNFPRPEAIEAIQDVTEFFEASLPADRPYFVQREIDTPFSSDPLVVGMTESTLIDIDAGGTGTYSVVTRREDPDTIRPESSIATRVYTGTSVVWAGTYAYSDSSSGLRESFEFRTETRETAPRRRQQSGEFRKESSGNASGGNRPIEGSYDLITGTIDGQPGCDPLSGTITYDSGFNVRTGNDFEFVETTTTIEKRDGERLWTVREVTDDGNVKDEFLTPSTGLGPFCDFPEL